MTGNALTNNAAPFSDAPHHPDCPETPGLPDIPDSKAFLELNAALSK